MLTSRGIDAMVLQPQPFYRHSTHDVRLDNLCHILLLYAAIPDLVRINHDVRSVLTLIQAAGLVGANACFKLACRNRLLEGSVQIGVAAGIATRPRTPRLTPIRTNKDMVFEISH